MSLGLERDTLALRRQKLFQILREDELREYIRKEKAIRLEENEARQKKEAEIAPQASVLPHEDDRFVFRDFIHTATTSLRLG